MTDTMMKRMQALEAVALAVEEWTIASPSEPHALERYAKVLSALDGWRRVRDALPASPPGEAVEVAVWERNSDGAMEFARSGGNADLSNPAKYWRRLGTVRMALVKEAGDAG